MIPTYVSYRNAIDNMAKTLDQIMEQPMVERETAYYTENIKSVKTLDDFLNDDRLFTYAMKAYGLEDMVFAKGMMRKVLSDPEFASKLTDKRYKQFTAAFDFNTYGAEATSQASATKATVNKYMQQSLEVQVGQSNEGTRLALYFTRVVGGMAKDETLDEDSWAYQLLSDKALTEVVFTALGISEDVRKSDVDAQKALIEARISFDDMKDPAKLEQFISRFSAMYDVENQVQYSPALMILESSSIQNSFGFSNDTMAAIQNLKAGSW